MNTWFNNFLQDLFNKCGVNNGLWLTQKQTEVCLRSGMNEVVVKRNNEETHSNFVTYWNNRKVVLWYSKVSKTGKITFYNNDEELQELNQIRLTNQEIEEIERFKKHPQELEKRIQLELNRIEMYEEDVKMDIEEGINPDENKKLLENSKR